MFSRFTEKAIQSIMLAQEEAKRFHHSYVGTEHILLGIIGEGDNVVIKTLQEMGFTTDQIINAIEERLEYGGISSDFRNIPFTQQAKQILTYAWDEARKLGHNYVNVEHLFLSVFRDPTSIAARVLSELGVDIAAFKNILFKKLGDKVTTVQKVKSAVPTPTLDLFGRDLTWLAKENKLDPVVGREKEIERIIQILCRRSKNNPVLTGEPGVGKTAIVEELNNLALFPFKYTKNVPMIMSAHIYFSQLDSINPATLSKSILTTLLRKKIKFEGVVITDHMDMKAVRKDLTIEEASLKAILAGSDIIMLGENINQIKNVVDYLVDAVKNGQLPIERLDQAVRRVIKMKKKYGLFDIPLLIPYQKVLKHPDHIAVGEQIVKRSVHAIVDNKFENKKLKDIKSALVISGRRSFNELITNDLQRRQINNQKVLLDKPLTHSEKWSYISKIMTEKLTLTPDLEDLIKNDKRINNASIKEIEKKSNEVDLIIVGIQTAAQAEDLNTLAAQIDKPIIGFFFGTRYDAPILYEKCPNFYASIVGYNNYYTQKSALEEMLLKLSDFL